MESFSKKINKAEKINTYSDSMMLIIILILLCTTGLIGASIKLVSFFAFRAAAAFVILMVGYLGFQTVLKYVDRNKTILNEELTEYIYNKILCKDFNIEYFAKRRNIEKNLIKNSGFVEYPAEAKTERYINYKYNNQNFEIADIKTYHKDVDRIETKNNLFIHGKKKSAIEGEVFIVPNISKKSNDHYERLIKEVSKTAVIPVKTKFIEFDTIFRFYSKHEDELKNFKYENVEKFIDLNNEIKKINEKAILKIAVVGDEMYILVENYNTPNIFDYDEITEEIVDEFKVNMKLVTELIDTVNYIE